MEEDIDNLSKRAEEMQRSAGEMSDRFSQLGNFEEAVAWTSDARALIRLLEQTCAEYTRFRADQIVAHQHAELARSSQSFIKRIFTLNGKEKQYLENAVYADSAINSIETTISHLSCLLERTQPNLFLLNQAKERQQFITIRRKIIRH